MEGEVVISAGKDETIYMWEPQSLTVLATFCENKSIYPQSLAYTRDFLLAAQGNKTLLHYYLVGKESPDKKSGVLEEVSALACQNSLVLGGSASGSLFLWDLNSSSLLVTWRPHYTKVSLVALDDWIVSASDDANIKVFRTSQVLESILVPYKEISINLLPVSGIIRQGQMLFTCSKDKSLCIFRNWEIVTQKFYTTVLTCIETFQSSQEVFLGSDDGQVYLYRKGDAWEIDSKPITSIKLTLSEQFLLISSQKVYVVNPNTGEKLKTFVMHLAEVSCMLCIPRPTDFVSGHLLHKTIKPLKKTLEAEPGIINFEFSRQAYEEEIEEAPAAIVQNTEELDRLRQANSILYRLWVEHCS